MSRPLRFIPEEGALVEITCRTIHSRYLLRPDPTLNEIVLGVLGRAQRLHPGGKPSAKPAKARPRPDFEGYLLHTAGTYGRDLMAEEGR
jgi:hypothetical protein